MKKVMKVTALLVMVGLLFSTGLKAQENSGSEDVYIEHDFVDLGLPSGTLWAKCNVGSDTPEGFGDYFSWGETESKTKYTLMNYKYYHRGGVNQLTKYCNSTDYGYKRFIDNLIVLEDDDDVATVVWGKDWRIPTKEEWNELCQNTINVWTTQNDVNGWLFTADNGNSIFLPAAGCCEASDVLDVSNYGYYWSKTLSTESPWGAWYFYFSLNGNNIYYYRRHLGQSVRPVRSAK